MRSRTLLGLTMVGITAFVAAACSSPKTLEVGSCIQDPGIRDRSKTIATVACDKEHRGEVIGVYQAADGPFPGTQPLMDEAEDTCKATFESFVGAPVSSSVYDLFPLVPSEASWDKTGDRSVFCVVRSSTGEPMTGSVKGAAH